MKLRDFILVVKPGIVVGNLIVALGAYAYSVKWSGAALLTFVWLALGTSVVIAASCVINNYLDRDIDQHMQRTAVRPTARGIFPFWVVIVYSALLYAVGFAVLYRYVNPLTAAIGAAGALLYIAAYTPAKRYTSWAALIGTIPGATPPLAGYAAAHNHLDSTAWLLFLVIAVWQVPHFYAISVFRSKQYARANVPVLPLAKGLSRTVLEMRIYGMVYILVCGLLGVYGGVHLVPTIALVVYGIGWLRVMMAVPQASESWARRVFYYSLPILPLFSMLLATNRWWVV